eukprot:1376730-Prymnesium_polylepis.1
MCPPQSKSDPVAPVTSLWRYIGPTAKIEPSGSHSGGIDGANSVLHTTRSRQDHRMPRPRRRQGARQHVPRFCA